MNALDRIIAYKRDEIRIAKANAPLSALDPLARAAGAPRDFVGALRRKAGTGFALIAEIKKASPSKGLIRENFDPPAHARAYAQGGAACLSVLTDGPSFQGDPEHLRASRAAVSLPVLRKDFMLDPYQMAEARAWGADCILLIMACLEPAEARDLEAAAGDYGLAVLAECHDREDVAKALDLKTPLVGINNRNLRTFHTDIATTQELAGLVPRGRIIVSESGIASHADIQRLAADGAGAFLVGESLMRQRDVEQATRNLLSGATRAV